MTLRASPSSSPLGTRRGSDKLTELARRRALDADAISPAVIIPAIAAVLFVAAVQWWLYTAGTWKVHPALTVDSAGQADVLLHYQYGPVISSPTLIHGIGAAVLLVPFQWALHAHYLDEPISDQCVLLIFTWGLAALVARWLCRLHTRAAPDSPIGFIAAGTILGSLAVPWPSVLVRPDSTATAIAVAAFFFISGLYIVWSNRIAPTSHLIPLLIAGGCWLLAALACPILLPTIVLVALVVSPFAMPGKRNAPVAWVTMLFPLCLMGYPMLHPGSAADWQAISPSHVMPNFRYFLAVGPVGNWRQVFTHGPHLSSGMVFDSSVLLLQLPLSIGLLFSLWGLVRTRPRPMKAGVAPAPAPAAAAVEANAPPAEPATQAQPVRHDPDKILITPRKPTGASLAYTLDIHSPLPPTMPDRPSRITPKNFTPAAAVGGAPVHRISPAVKVVPLAKPTVEPMRVGLIWLPVALLAATLCTGLTTLSLPAPSALSFALNTQAIALLLVLTWWSFVARHKTRPAFHFSLSIATALALLTLLASYLSITLLPA